MEEPGQKDLNWRKLSNHLKLGKFQSKLYFFQRYIVTKILSQFGEWLDSSFFRHATSTFYNFRSSANILDLFKTRNMLKKTLIQVSISSTFYARLLRQKITKPNITREMLLNSLLYEKCAGKMMMKLTPDVCLVHCIFCLLWPNPEQRHSHSGWFVCQFCHWRFVGVSSLCSDYTSLTIHRKKISPVC